MQMVDFSAPLGAPIVYELANRFRLEKVDPGRALAGQEADHLLHRPRRARAGPHRAAGRASAGGRRRSTRPASPDAFRAEILPEGADPLDIRYNVVNWVNRATRGWSYGQPIADPRTGEIIKGQVLLGSLRVRQDLIIYQALVGAGLTGTGDPNDPITAALARIRQLGAHEVGHALGLAHNFAASTQGRYSVMDYPAPRVHAGERRADPRRCLWRRASAAGTGSRSTGSTARAQTPKARRAMAAGACAGSALRRRRRRRPADAPATARQPVGRRRRPGRRARADDGGPRRAAIARFGTGAMPAGEPLAAASPRVRADLAAPPLSGRGRGEIARRRRLRLRGRRRAVRRPQWRPERPGARLTRCSPPSPAALTVPPRLHADPLGRVRGRQRPSDGHRDHADRRRPGFRSA